MICTVCFSGTSHRLASQLIDHKLSLYSQTLAGFIYANSCNNNEDFVIGFDGCGITHPLSGLGGLFASGLQDHARCVEEKIRDQLKKNPQEKITLNVYGHSRGAIAALYLSQYLKDLSSEKLEINLALLDPVPGTYLWVANLGTGLSVAEKSIDLSTCGNLSHVLCLYPNVPLPDILCHAPLFPIWPKKCRVEEMVIPGCHSEAEIHYYFMEKNKKKFMFSCASFIASIKVCRFLCEHGAQLSNMPDEE